MKKDEQGLARINKNVIDSFFIDFSKVFHKCFIDFSNGFNRFFINVSKVFL